MSKVDVNGMIDRLTKYDPMKYPPGSPEKLPPPPRNGKVLPKEGIQSMLDRLTHFDATVTPPESRVGRKHIGYGIYDHYHGPELNRGPKKPITEVDKIVDRLRDENWRKCTGKQEPITVKSKKVNEDEAQAIFERLQKCDFTKYPPDSSIGNQEPPVVGTSRKVKEDEAKAIFERLQKCDFAKYPPDSAIGRVDLGNGIYGYNPPSEPDRGPSLPKGKVEEIVQRLKQYDITKYPPESRGHEKK